MYLDLLSCVVTYIDICVLHLLTVFKYIGHNALRFPVAENPADMFNLSYSI